MPTMHFIRFILIPFILFSFLPLCYADITEEAQKHYKEGIKFYTEGQFEKAVESFKEAVRIKTEFAHAYYGLGISFDESGQYEEAIEHYNKAMTLYKASGNFRRASAIEGEIYLIKGLLVKDKNLLEAEDFYIKALKIGEDLGYQNLEQRTLIKLLELLGLYVNSNKALRYSERLLELYRVSKDSAGKLDALIMIGFSHYFLGNYSKALEHYQKALKIARKKGNLIQESRVMSGLSEYYLTLGDYQKAIDYQWKSIKLAQKIGDKVMGSDSYELLGRIYEYLGDNTKAIEYTLLALKRLENMEDNIKIDKGFIYSRLARLYRDSDEYLNSLNYFQKALDEYQRLEQRIYEGNTYAEMGRIYSYIGNNTEAINYLQKAITIHSDIGAEFWEMFDYSEAEHIYTALGDYTKARAYLQKGLEIAQKRNDHHFEYLFFRSIGFNYSKVGSHEKAYNYFKRALNVIDNKGGHLHHKLTILGLLGFTSWGLGKTDETISYFSKAINLVETMSSNLKLETDKISLMSDYLNLSIYQAMIIELLILGKEEEAFNYVERAKSRAFLDMLGNRVKLSKGRDREVSEEEKKLREKINTLIERIEKALSQPHEKQKAILAVWNRELQETRKAYAQLLTRIKRENPELSTLISVSPLTLKEIQEVLDPDTTLLEYFVTPGGIFLWIVSKSDLKEIGIDIKELIMKVDKFRGKIAALQPDYKKEAEELYDLLIRPAKPYIKTKRIGIVPHSILHYLPFQALIDTDDKPRFLIEEYEIFYTPSASVLKFVYEKRKKVTGKILAFGNPDLGDKKYDLPYAEEEVKKIKALYPETALYMKSKATKEKLKKLSGDYNIIHFASHGELNPENPLFSSIRLAKDKDEDGRLEVHEIFNLNLKNTSLVTLSACETGLGKLTQGDELIGMTRGFIYAGTPSIVASLWSVNDRSTSELMGMFYKNLKNHSKAEALRMAQIEMIRGEVGKGIVRGVGGITTSKEAKPRPQSSMTVNGSHPYFWAPFILLGDWK